MSDSYKDDGRGMEGRSWIAEYIEFTGYGFE